MRPIWLHRASQSASEGPAGHIHSRGEFHEVGFALGGSAEWQKTLRGREAEKRRKTELLGKARRLGRTRGSGSGRLSIAERGRVQDSAARKESMQGEVQRVGQCCEEGQRGKQEAGKARLQVRAAEARSGGGAGHKKRTPD